MKLNKKTLIIITFFVSSVGFVMYSDSDFTSAATIVPEKYCKNALNKTKCISALTTKKCTTDACATAEVKKSGGLVVTFCRDKSDPQGCQKDYVKACGGKTAKGLSDCQKEFTTKLNSGSTTSGNSVSGGASGAAGVSLSSEYYKPQHACGNGSASFKTQMNLGCRGEGNGIVDLTYSIIRFLSIGVGLVLIGSMIYAGIMYTMSGGNPEQTTAAKNRIRDAVIALAFYLLIFAMIQFLVPGGLFT